MDWITRFMGWMKDEYNLTDEEVEVMADGFAEIANKYNGDQICN